MLEKSRVVFQNELENNFHIFYYLMAGMFEQNKQKEFYLQNEENFEVRFYYLKNFSLQKLDDASRQHLCQKYDELINALNYIAFMESELKEVFSILLGILHVGNLRFKASEEGYAKFVYTSDTKNTLLAISNLLGINTSALIESLTTSLPTAGGRDEFLRNYTLEGALDARDALAKHVYFKLFTWMVNKINKTLSYDKSNNLNGSSNLKNSHLNEIKQISILDIYGFEHFEKNSFEQLCINLANEQIQYFFNKVNLIF